MSAHRDLGARRRGLSMMTRCVVRRAYIGEALRRPRPPFAWSELALLLVAAVAFAAAAAAWVRP